MTTLLLTILACASTPRVGSSPADVSTAVHRFEEGKLRRMKTVAYRPVDPASDAGQWLVSALPRAQWDAALASAAGELISQPSKHGPLDESASDGGCHGAERVPRRRAIR